MNKFSNDYIEITADFDLSFTKDLMIMYEYFCQNHNGESIQYSTLPYFADFMSLLNKKMYQNDNVFTSIGSPVQNKKVLVSSNTVLVGYSSGVDSTYQALRFKKQGYNVILFHCNNLNRSYPDEKDTAKLFADKYGFQMVTVDIKHNNVEYFIDNPTKNQCLIIGCMLDYCIANNINKLALGSHVTDTFDNCHVQYSITDAHETFDYFLDAIDKYILNLEYYPIDSKKFGCYKFLIDNYPESLTMINSCVAPHRFKKHLNKQNRTKYNLQPITDNRCMICHKCIKEYVMLVNLGFLERNEEYINHCFDYLRKKGDTISDVGLANKKSTNDEIERNIINA